MSDKYSHIDFVPPKSVQKAAERGLELRREAPKGSKGGLNASEASKEGIGSGVQRAVNLKNGDKISPAVVKRMKSFFDRHAGNEKIDKGKTRKTDKGYQAYLLWGGAPGKRWANKIVNQMEKADEKAKMESITESVFEKYIALFEATLDEIHEKYYPGLERDVFDKLNAADPTSKDGKKKGRYLPWLIDLWNDKKLKMEDLYKASEYLQYYNKYKNYVDEKDINKIDSIQHLYRQVEDIIKKHEEGSEEIKSKAEKEKEIKDQAEKYYEDDKWLVIVPKTKEASCLYGKGTQWCTAAEVSHNAFDAYNENGPLFIMIYKPTGDKYQYHGQSKMMANAADEDIVELIEENLPDREELEHAGEYELIDIENRIIEMVPDARIIEEIPHALLKKWLEDGIPIRYFLEIDSITNGIFSVSEMREADSYDHPQLLFHRNATNPYGKNQFHKEKFIKNADSIFSYVIKNREVFAPKFDHANTSYYINPFILSKFIDYLAGIDHPKYGKGLALTWYACILYPKLYDNFRNMGNIFNIFKQNIPIFGLGKIEYVNIKNKEEVAKNILNISENFNLKTDREKEAYARLQDIAAKIL